MVTIPISVEDIYFIIAIFALAGTGVVFIWNSSRKWRKIEEKAEQHDKCIIRLEGKIESLGQHLDKAKDEVKEDIKETKDFFIDWIQRVENVTRDRFPPVIPTFQAKDIKDVDEGEKVLTEMGSNETIKKRQETLEQKLDRILKYLDERQI